MYDTYLVSVCVTSHMSDCWYLVYITVHQIIASKICYPQTMMSQAQYFM